MLASFVFLGLTISQPLLEGHSFRQTQTAITSYWFIREGFALAYQTPVAGYPWTIPFEFPIYQAIVAAISAISTVPLDRVGRAVSFFFFVATLIPVALICRRLQLGLRVFLIFGTVYLLSPQYLFWGRTFMIESTATFLSVAAIAAALPLLTDRTVSRGRYVAFVVFGCLAVLQKITTALPVILVLMVCVFAIMARRWNQRDRAFAKAGVARILVLAIPILAGMAWTHFSDVAKSQSDIGMLLTSAGLRKWNFGTLEQRFSSALYRDVILMRSMRVNAGGWIGIAALAWFYAKETRPQRVTVALVAGALFVAPLLLFSNLHIVHDYYQTATTVYIIFLLALALAYVAETLLPRVFAVALALVLVSNLSFVKQVYWPTARGPITAENNRTLALAEVIKSQTARDAPLLVYGLSLSSELAYYAERKSTNVPEDYKEPDAPLRDPGRFFGRQRPGALVMCPVEDGPEPAAAEVERFLRAHAPVRAIDVQDCRIYILGGAAG